MAQFYSNENFPLPNVERPFKAAMAAFVSASPKECRQECLLHGGALSAHLIPILGAKPEGSINASLLRASLAAGCCVSIAHPRLDQPAF
jgi:hypothetical protein